MTERNHEEEARRKAKGMEDALRAGDKRAMQELTTQVGVAMMNGLQIYKMATAVGSVHDAGLALGAAFAFFTMVSSVKIGEEHDEENMGHAHELMKTMAMLYRTTGYAKVIQAETDRVRSLPSDDPSPISDEKLNEDAAKTVEDLLARLRRGIG